MEMNKTKSGIKPVPSNRRIHLEVKRMSRFDLLYRTELPHRAIAVYIYLVDQANKDGECRECFPHEIGVFLDYPLADVIGFIEHGGKNCKCCDVWKVYSNECATQVLFTRFMKCTEVYLRVFARGKLLIQMTVAA